MEIEGLRAAILGGDWSSSTLRALADAQDALAAAEASRQLCVVGRRVRVARGEATARAMISSVNDDGSLDVVYEEDDEEGVVRSASALEPFEEDEGEPEPRERKERGSRLFRLKDYGAAEAEYQACLAALRALWPLRVGSTVMVNSAGALRVGTASSVSEKSLDVVYDDVDDDDDLSRKRLLAVLPPTADDRLLMLTTLLNAARCAHHRKRFADAVAGCTLAAGVARHDDHADHLLTSRIVRARAHLAQSHLKQAIRDSNAASELAPNDKAALALARDVDRAKKIALKANKKLAREVSDWVSTVMSKNSHAADALEAADDLQ
mmetsp:Transcript_2487/g.7735  ORF Transcript_2487/g.7735 Transcript_2487/m.7735 type:complete len:322 (-) Transcript_2487:191-1156(-)